MSLEELSERRQELKQWLAEHDEDHADYAAKKEESKALKQQMKALQEEAEEEGAEVAEEAEVVEDAAAAPPASTGAPAAEGDEEHALRTLNEWKTRTGHNYKCFIAPVKAPADKEDEPKKDDKGDKKSSKKKKAAAACASEFRCTLTAVPKKAKNNMFETADSDAVDLTTLEAPIGEAEGSNKNKAKRLAAAALVAKLSAPENEAWGWAKMASSGQKSSRFQKMESQKPKALNMAPEEEGKTHPCLRVWGECQFGDDCQFALFPYNTCLSFLKGKCTHGEKCVEPHDVDVNDPKYQNNQPKPKPMRQKYPERRNTAAKRESRRDVDTSKFNRGPNWTSNGNQSQQQGGGGGMFNHDVSQYPADQAAAEGEKCFKCGKVCGYKSRDCPNERACYRCGKPGCNTRICPLPRTDFHSNGGQGYNPENFDQNGYYIGTGGRGARGGGGGGRGAARGGSSGRGGGRGGRGGSDKPWSGAQASGSGGRWGMSGRGYGYGDENRPSKFQRLDLGDDDDE